MIIKIWQGILITVGFFFVIFAIIFPVIGFFIGKDDSIDPVGVIGGTLIFLSMGAICLYFGFPSKQTQKGIKRFGAAIIFWIFGLHYLYFRKWGWLILFWLSGWGFFVWWVIDIFRLKALTNSYNQKISLQTEKNEASNFDIDTNEATYDDKEYKKTQKSDNKFERLNSLLKEQFDSKK